MPPVLQAAMRLTPEQRARLSDAEIIAIGELQAAYDQELIAADPVEFFRQVLGVEPWSRQAEILRAVADHPRVAVRSGHKIGKSLSCAGLALWWYATRPRARVVMTSSSDGQVKNILWPEVTQLYNAAARRGRPIEGELYESHQSGIKHPDGRHVFGFATNKTERMGGFSGDQLLFIVDEASGVEENIFEAIEGNRAGGARVVMFGNPTRTSGAFFEAFHDKADFWHTVRVSSEETPNVAAGRPIVPGLATREWVEEKRAEWGEDGPVYAYRVRGDFPREAQNAVIGLATVQDAIRRHDRTAADGPLEVGVDVARFGDDDTVIFVVRGKKAFAPVVLHSLDTVQVAGRVLQVVRDHAREGERAKVKVDVIGVGAGVADHLRANGSVDVVDVNVGASAGDPNYERLRDEVWFRLGRWLKDGGAIPHEPRLEAELTRPTFSYTVRQRIKVESKDEMKKRLGGRSTDLADALALAVYRSNFARAEATSPSPMSGQDSPSDVERIIQRRIEQIERGY